jgi:heme exporter protein B
MTGVQVAAAVAAKDLRIELRGRYATGTLLPFVGTVLLAFGFALGPGRALLATVAPGLLWLAALLAGVLLFRRSYEAEAADDALEGLLLCRADKAGVFLGKAAAVAVQLVALLVVSSLLVVVLFGLPLGAGVATLAATYILGSIGLAAVGALFGAIAVAPQTREAVLPVLVLPVVTPVLIAAIKATTLAAAGSAGRTGDWLGLLLAFDAVFVAAGAVCFGHLLED